MEIDDICTSVAALSLCLKTMFPFPAVGGWRRWLVNAEFAIAEGT